jgi:murein DD-endopeptidase MepM/ murein hydrolase activator NlpD
MAARSQLRDPVLPSVAPDRRRSRARWTALLVVVGLTGLPAAASAQARSSSEVQRELVVEQRRAAQLGEELGSVRGDILDAEAELAEIGARLEDARGRLRAAEGQVALGEAALEEAQAEQASAERAHDRAERVLARTESELADEEATLADQIVQSFKYGTVGATRGAMVLEVLRRADDPNAFSVGMKQLKVVVDFQETTVQRVFALRDQRAVQAEEAARSRAAAIEAAAHAADALAHLQRVRDEAEVLAAQVAEDEERQQVVLASLRSSAAETESMLQRVAARQGELEREYAQKRAEEEAARIAAERAEAERRAAEEARREREARRAGEASAGTSGSSGSASTTSTGSAAGAPGGPPLAGGYCPVVGAVAGRDFSNDWGYPRSGGRTHQGNDIFANEGTPIVAIQAGVVVRTSPTDRGLGGITVTYRTADGSEWYNAHLLTIADGIAPGVAVEAGQEVGTVGRSGNARTTPPHNHIGRRYNGSWVNPYPSIAPLCR